MTTRRQFLLYVATALAAVGVFAGDVAQAGKPPAKKLTVSVSPSTILEGSTATGTVTHNNASLTSPVTVTLSSNDTTEATVAATVIIPAGTNTVNFAVTAINDNIADGSQPVTITTAATGYASGSTNVTVKDPPPVTYALKMFSMPPEVVGTSGVGVRPREMLSSGVVVGEYSTTDGVTHPFFYDASVNPDTAIDLNNIGIVGLPDGWRIVKAYSINAHNFVVGAMEEITNPGVWRGYLLDLATKQLTSLPDGPNHTYARQINDNMDIVGVSRGSSDTWYSVYLYNPWFDVQTTDLGLEVGEGVSISNPPLGFPAQVAGIRSNGLAFRYTQGLGVDPAVGFAAYNVYDISPSGMIAGSYQWGRRSQNRYAFRFATNFESFPELREAYAINDAGDMVNNSGILTLYHQGTGAIDLTETLVGSPEDLSLWQISQYHFMEEMTERGAINSEVPNFPGLCGSLFYPDSNSINTSRGFVLVPVIPSAP